MGQVTVTGTLIEAPATVADGSVPSGVTTVGFTLNTGSTPKGAIVSTGAKVRNVNSPSAFVPLSGVGAADDVTQADTVYVRTAASGFTLRITFNNPLGGTTQATVPLFGLFILEADPTKFVTLLEVQGSGVVEYFASGRQ